MPVRCIHYRGGYKYQLCQDYVDVVGVTPEVPIATEYILLSVSGDLTLRRGYAWDGPSGPTLDTKSFMRGSLVHDGLYQLMRLGKLDRGVWRESADRELWRICREDGMWRIRAWWVFKAVQTLGDPSASPESRKGIEWAPTPQSGDR